MRILLRTSMKWAMKVDDPRFFLNFYQDTERDLLQKYEKFVGLEITGPYLLKYTFFKIMNIIWIMLYNI